MATDCKSFNKRILLGRKIRRWVELSCWNNKMRPKAAITVDAKCLMMFTTIGFTETA
jgi:hypothetical protein